MIYLLDGDTFTGKTTYLRRFIENHPSKVSCYITDEKWIEMLIDCANEADSDEQCVELFASKFLKFDVLCIDNIDFLYGKTATQTLSARTILKLKQDRDILLAGIDLRQRINTMIEEFSNNDVSVFIIDFNSMKKESDKA